MNARCLSQSALFNVLLNFEGLKEYSPSEARDFFEIMVAIILSRNCLPEYRPELLRRCYRLANEMDTTTFEDLEDIYEFSAERMQL